MTQTTPPRTAMQIANAEVLPIAEAFGRTTAGAVRTTLAPVYRRMDAALAAAPLRPACRVGCAFCCHYRVQVSAAEAFALAEQIKAMPAAPQAELRARLAATAERVAPLSSAAYEATNVPCAFLQQGRCSVYTARPSPCRGHHALDAGVCERTFVDPASTEMNALDPVRHEAHEGFKSAILFAQYHAGRDASSYEMHGAVQAALTNPGAFKRWRAGKVAFPEVRDRQSVAEVIAPAER